MEQWIIGYWKQHGVVGVLAAWVVFSAVANLLTRVKSPEEWVKFAEAYPKLNTVLKLIRGWGVDPVALLEALKVYSERKAETSAAALKAEQEAMNSPTKKDGK